MKKTLIKTIENKFGVNLKYKSDNELYKDLKEVPSLVKLLKMTI